MEQPRFASFREFYPYYLQQHTERISRRLHVAGTLLALALAVAAIALRRWAWLWAVPLVGYVPAWLGHFLFERNAPATFRHPLYSLRGDFTMLIEVLSGRRRW
ncbi:MAG TPA: DUF962 domain-containing protein [Steroidobacteraceae bacterium]|nr:DUF962 domain-containing protein [Steroidobacteraceae bacterium]